MIHLLRVTAFNLPRLTRLVGVVLALLLGVVHLWVLTHTTAPAYLNGLFAAASAGSFLAAVALGLGLRGVGWPLGVTVSGGGFAAYVVSRAVGFPRFAEATGAWHNALGTSALILEVLMGAIYVSLLAGWNVDTPGQRDWDTYFSSAG